MGHPQLLTAPNDLALRRRRHGVRCIEVFHGISACSKSSLWLSPNQTSFGSENMGVNALQLVTGYVDLSSVRDSDSRASPNRLTQRLRHSDA